MSKAKFIKLKLGDKHSAVSSTFFQQLRILGKKKKNIETSHLLNPSANKQCNVRSPTKMPKSGLKTQAVNLHAVL